MMMVVFRNLFELRYVQQLGEIIEVKHRIVLTVIAKERDVLAEVHILQVISDKTAVTTLNTLTELIQYFWFCCWFHLSKRKFYHTDIN